MPRPRTTRSGPPTSGCPATTASCPPSIRTGWPSARRCGRRRCASWRRPTRSTTTTASRWRPCARSSTVAEDLRELGEEESMLNNIDSPLQAVRDIFDLMPTETADDWAVGAQRLAAVPTSVDGYIASLRLAADRGQVRARRQVEIAIKQCGGNVGPDGFFGTWAREAATADGGRAARDAACRPRPQRRARRGRLRQARDVPAGRAGRPGRRARGRSVASGTRSTRGASSAHRSISTRPTPGDRRNWPASTRRWRPTAGRIRPGASVAEAIEALDTDPARRLDGHGRAPGLDAAEVRRSDRRTRRHATSTSPSRSAGWSAASPRPTPAASTTPARATTWSAVPAGCGGRCRRASPRSRRGRS